MAAAVILLAALHTSPTEAKVYSCRDYVDLAREVGWPKSERGNIRRIMYRESRCYAGAWNRKDPHGGSYGLMQINGSNVGWAIRNGWIERREDLFRPRQNLRVALELWRLYGWRPWGTKSSINQ